MAACAVGSVCTFSNPYYSQCLPGTATTSVVTGPSTATSTAPVPAQTGFVKASGTRFTLNGAPYTVFGYSVHRFLSRIFLIQSLGRTRTGWPLGGTAPPTLTRLSPTSSPVEPPLSGKFASFRTTLTDVKFTEPGEISNVLKCAGASFLARGFNEVTAANGIYFHLWSGSTATVNTGSNGLGMLGAWSCSSSHKV